MGTNSFVGTETDFAREVWLPRVIADTAAQHQDTDVPVKLLFDSYLEAVPTGIRLAAMNVRQALFRADPYQIDLQLEEEPERNRLVVMGQLLDASSPRIVGQGVEITLSNRGPGTIKTKTNQFGEFRAELQSSGDLELSFLGHNGKPMVILLTDTPKPSPERKE